MLSRYNFFYFPVVYTYVTRLQRPSRLFSWMMIYVVPVSYACVGLQTDFSLRHLLTCWLGMIFVYNFYETGYIENDTETIKRESCPTLRVSLPQRDFYERHKKSIYGSRLLWGILLGGMIYMSVSDKVLALRFIGVVCSLLPLYGIYNRIRNNGNLYMHIVLVTIRYCSCLLLFWGPGSFRVLGVAWFAFPFPNFMERASTPRFNQLWAWRLVRGRGIAFYRAVYYMLACSAATCLYFFSVLEGKDLVLFYYYLIYRLLIFFFIR